MQKASLQTKRWLPSEAKGMPHHLKNLNLGVATEEVHASALPLQVHPQALLTQPARDCTALDRRSVLKREGDTGKNGQRERRGMDM